MPRVRRTRQGGQGMSARSAPMTRTGAAGRSRRRPWFRRGCTRLARVSGDALGFPLEEVADAPRDVDAQRAVGEQHREDVRAEEAARVLLEGEAAPIEL